MNVWILCINHKHGTDLTAYATYEKARDSLYEYVSEYWEEGVDTPLPEDKGQAIREYFEDSWHGECYDIMESPIY